MHIVALLKGGAMNHYDVLGVSLMATPEEITSCYRRIAMKTHPDRNGGDEKLSLRFKQATTAYETLSDAAKKEEYDRTLLNNIIEDPKMECRAAWNRIIDQVFSQPKETYEPQPDYR